MFFYIYNVDYNVKNMDKVLESVIVFCSIVVGFLGALLGILVSIKDSDIIKEIFSSNANKTLKSSFYETFILGFMLVLLSITLQVIICYPSKTTLIIFYVWVILIGTFVPSSYKIINFLMNVFFKSNYKNKSKRPNEDKLNDSDKSEIKKRLAK